MYPYPYNVMQNLSSGGWGSSYGSSYRQGGGNYGEPMYPDSQLLPDIMTPQINPQMNPDMQYSLPMPNPEYGSGNNTNEFGATDPYASNNGQGQFTPSSNYAEGGRAEYNPESLQALAQILQTQGQREDTVLAHINPQEAALLEQTFGGDVNPHTGLPQYGLFNKPGKWFASVAPMVGGTIIGNALLPGVGGIAGAAVGGGAGAAIRGSKSPMKSAMRGAGVGAMIPSIASGTGSLLNNPTLTKYGESNAIVPALDKLIGGGSVSKGAANAGLSSLLSNGASSSKEGTAGNNPLATAVTPEKEKTFYESLMGKSKDFFSEPQNLLALGAAGLSFMNRPKEKTPEQLGEEERRRQLALLYTPAELQRLEAQNLEMERAKRRIQRNKYLPEERIYDIEPIHRKAGGRALPNVRYEEEAIYPNGLAELLRGSTGGQDDDINKPIREGDYIVDASTVSNLGDGNTEAGARKINAWLSDGEMRIPNIMVTKLGKGSNEEGAKALDHMIRNVRKHKGGSTELPPRAKSITQYMR